MLIGRFELPTSPLPRVRSTNWAISAHLERAAGIEPASSAWKAEVIAIIRCPHPETRLPSSFCNKKRDKSLFSFEPIIFLTSPDSNCCQKVVVGEGFEPSKSVTADLQSAPFGRSGTPPDLMVPTTGIELVTYWLQVSCSTYWAKSASSSAHSMETCELMQLKNCIKCSIAHILHYTTNKWRIFSQSSIKFRHYLATHFLTPVPTGTSTRQTLICTSGISVTLLFR